VIRSAQYRSAGKVAVAAIVAVAALLGAGATAPAALASSATAGQPRPRAFADQVILNGAQLEHGIPGGSERLTKPDDITYLDGHVFVAFQNGVGPQGEPSASGNLASTVVELNRRGYAVQQWDITGKCDGLTADPTTGSLIATVNEDANSSLYTIDPASGEIAHYEYSEPLPSAGGTDAISIYRGMVLISASAPGTTGAPAPEPFYPAAYEVELNAATHIAAIQPLFSDEAPANVANSGVPETVTLMLTDPDSNEDVPRYAPRFAGDFMLTSQGDQEQVFASDVGGPDQALSVLKLSSSVDDTVWPSVPFGSLYVTDNGDDTVNRIVGPFQPGSVLVADTPCGENSAPSVCPAPGFPANFLGQLNPWTGTIAPVTLLGATVHPQGMLFLP
jgi:hypothetical protein